MATPPTTTLLLQSPPAPSAILMESDCESLMPVLLLPPPVTRIQNQPLPTLTTSSNQPSSTPNLRHPPPVNSVSTPGIAEQHFPMSIAFHPRHPTTYSCLTPEPNSSRLQTSPPLSRAPSADLSVAQAHEFPTTSVVCTKGEARQ